MKGYVFVGNSTKPTEAQYTSLSPIALNNFCRPCIKAALDMGYQAYYGVSRKNPEAIECDYPVRLYDQHTYRSLTAFSDNRIAVKNLSDVIVQGNVSVIHCNTPIGGMVGRLCGRKYKIDKVIYTAHGFHFYNGAPLFNRTVLKWAEQLMARWTDAIITINREDYEAAKRFKLKRGGKVYFVHGVGIDTAAYTPSAETRASKRAELGLGEEDFCVVSVGRLDANKNNETLIRAIGKLENKNVRLIICGDGEQRERLTDLMAELGVADRVTLLGNRNDMAEIYCAVDALAMASFREGLSRTLMEAMASGLPCVASKIRGNVDLIEDGVGGYLRAPNDVDGFAEAISKLASDAELCAKMRESNLETVKSYDVSVVEKEIREIYREVLAEN